MINSDDEEAVVPEYQGPAGTTGGGSGVREVSLPAQHANAAGGTHDLQEDKLMNVDEYVAHHLSEPAEGEVFEGQEHSEAVVLDNPHERELLAMSNYLVVEAPAESPTTLA